MDSAQRCWHDNDHHHDYLTRLLKHFSGDGKNILMVPFTVTNFLLIGARCGNKAPKQWKFWIITIFSPRMGESLGRYLRDLYSYRDAFRQRRYSQFGRFCLTRNQTISKISKYFGQWCTFTLTPSTSPPLLAKLFDWVRKKLPLLPLSARQVCRRSHATRRR